jgi:hypothetical protein
MPDQSTLDHRPNWQLTDQQSKSIHAKIVWKLGIEQSRTFLLAHSSCKGYSDNTIPLLNVSVFLPCVIYGLLTEAVAVAS